MKKFYLSILTILLAVAASAQTPTSVTLEQLINQGETGNTYTITDELLGVYVPPHFSNVIFAKDENHHVAKSEPSASQIANHKVYDDVASFDQSNWIKILFPQGFDASIYKDKILTNVTGMVHVASAPGGPVGLYIGGTTGVEVTTVGDASSYNGNLYCVANFAHQEWFFVRPKTLEYARIRWAVYNGNNTFYVPSNSQWPGSFKVDMTFWEDDNTATANSVFTVGEAYEFSAIIRFSNGTDIGVGIDPGFEGDLAPQLAPMLRDQIGAAGTPPEGYNNIMVYPLKIDKVVTSIDDVDTASEVKSVQYYDMQGRMSNAPLKGMNIKVTTYSDGSTTREKVLH